MALSDRRLLAAGGVVLGFGFGGLVDGIVLHQVLQWHNLTAGVVDRDTLPGLERNLFWDGVFHLATAGAVAAGVVLVWLGLRDAPREPVRTLVGLALVGWGVFHVVDQLLFHLALGLHDIRQEAANAALYNWGFFALGLLLAAAGAELRRRGTAE